jgi:endoglucanase
MQSIKNKKGPILLLILVFFSLGYNGFAYNYAEVLQKSFFFYECQQSGTLPSWNRVEWRGPSCLADTVTGGWYDAGDHVKFGLPMSASAGMLLWAAYEYKSALTSTGQWDIFTNNVKFVLDYLVRCHQGSQLVYQVGDGGNDHAYWGPVESIEEMMTRPSYACNASCVLADTAATLALGYLVFNDSSYLTHAKSLFSTADTVRSDDSYTKANGFYDSFSGYWDDLMWAATWLYIATGDSSYLAKAESYIPNLEREGYQPTDPIKYKWTQSWDDKHYGAFLLLARKTGNTEYNAFMEMFLDFWTSGYDGSKVTYTPGGLAWLDQWGSLRYAANTAFLAFVYADSITDATKKAKYQAFAKRQIDYALGDNPRNSSYVVGFGTNAPQHPHHRNAHSSYKGLINDPATHKHILYGALVGGPGSGDGYTDAIDNYTNNEVACDYNAAFTGCIMKLVTLNGGTPLSNFPQPETKTPEMFTQACYNSGYGTYTEIRLSMNNQSAWPPRVSNKLSARYYVDLTEVFDSGLSLSNVYTKMSSTDAKISGLVNVTGNIYYATIDFTGTKLYPGNMNSYHKDIQFQIGLSTGTPDNWSTANDFSFTGMTSSFATTNYIPVYENGVLVFGNEYGGNGTPQPTPVTTVEPTAIPTTGPTPDPTPVNTPAPTGTVLLGDVNSNATIDIVDALLVAQYYVGLPVSNFNTQAADVNTDGSIDIIDALRIAQYYVGLIPGF